MSVDTIRKKKITNVMTDKEIRAVGYFLSFYQSDLNYIFHFQRYLEGKNSFEYITSDKNGTFYKFLKEFKVIRNTKKEAVGEVLNSLHQFIKMQGYCDVDSFAIFLKDKNLTHGKIATSLASKILFLYNPWHIIPFDNRVKKSLGLTNDNIYADYQQELDKFKISNKIFIKNILAKMKSYTSILEKPYLNDLHDISSIRTNRLIDKFLWVN